MKPGWEMIPVRLFIYFAGFIDGFPHPFSEDTCILNISIGRHDHTYHLFS